MKRLQVSKTTNAYLKDKRRYIRVGMKLTPLDINVVLGIGKTVLRKLTECLYFYKKPRIHSHAFKTIKLNVYFITKQNNYFYIHKKFTLKEIIKL